MVNKSGYTQSQPGKRNGRGVASRSKSKTVQAEKATTPKDIVERMDGIVVGQQDAKRKLAVGLLNHFKRINDKSANTRTMGDLADVTLEKSNVLLIGPSGSGKTYLVQALAERLEIPFAIADATSLTESGYVGDDVDTMLHSLIRSANGDLESAENGIIFIDEIDKLRKTSGNVSNRKDPSGEGVQQALLKMIEGTLRAVTVDPMVNGRKHPEAATIELNTKNILFICAGAFTGLSEIVSDRLGRKTPSGKSPLSDVTAEDLIKFGMIPEFIGRVPVVVALDALTVDDLMAILTEPRNAILKQYRKLLRMDGIEISFAKDALKEIATQALKLGTGARGLRSVVESFMTDVVFDLTAKGPGDYQLDAAVVRGASLPRKMKASASRSNN
jgi:ATP-dependent Clp protease ATP-binding subunit ClpX